MLNKKIEKSEYDIQAETFLEKGNITFGTRFLFHGPHWEGDEETRNVWDLTLTRIGKPKPLSVRFGQSIADSFLYPQNDTIAFLVPYNSPKKSRNPIWCENHKRASQHKKPTAYDMLACLTKYDPGTFEDFCGEFGYDTDSRKAEKTYFEVQKEWNQVRAFFTPEELQELSEIN